MPKITTPPPRRPSLLFFFDDEPPSSLEGAKEGVLVGLSGLSEEGSVVGLSAEGDEGDGVVVGFWEGLKDGDDVLGLCEG